MPACVPEQVAAKRAGDTPAEKLAATSGNGSWLARSRLSRTAAAWLQAVKDPRDDLPQAVHFSERDAGT
ncbi:hypothetical protein CN108_18500 [Sinorhizobium meliloti]|nr:hypothetical protein CN108_18500 [Sinorhizobium meliloti]